MNEERVKQAVFETLSRAVDARALAGAIAEAAGDEGALQASQASPPSAPSPPAPSAPSGRAAADALLSRIVLGDILDDAILSARPSDRTFPLRLLFSELGRLLTETGEKGDEQHTSVLADQAFTLASGLNFFFRASMDEETKLRVGMEVSRQFYSLVHAAKLDEELMGRASPLVAALLTGHLERVKLESVDHMKVFDSQIHERAPASDPTASRIVRAASFLCRVTANNGVKVKAQVVT